MKKLILIILTCISTTICLAQIQTNLLVLQQPPGSLISWGVKDLTYIISNQTGAPRQALIKSVLTTADGTPVASTNLALAKLFVIDRNTLVLYARDVIPLEAMAFVGKYKTSLERTGKLPAGSYQLCVQLVTPVDFAPISEQRCRNFTLAAFQLPIPILPANEEVMEATKAQTSITFRWTPVAPRPSEQVKYIVTVFEILDKQTPMQALRSNQPLLTKEIIGTTQFIWQPQLSFIKTKIWADTPSDSATAAKQKVEQHGRPHEIMDGKMASDSIDESRFIWTIQTLSLSDVPFSDGNVNADGISEPNVFTIIADRRRIKTGVPARVIYLNKIMDKQN